MKTVATVVDTNISALIGPTKNIKRIYTNRKLFENEGIALVGPYFPGGEELDGDAYRQSRSFKLKSLIKGILRSGTASSWLLYRLTHRRNANQALDKYFGDTGDNVDLVVFRDITSASEYLNRGGKSPFVLVLHCDGTNDMFFSESAFSKLKGTKYQSHLDEAFANVRNNASGLLFLSPKAISKFADRYGMPSCPTGFYHQGLNKPKANAVEGDCRSSEGCLTFISVGTVCKRKNQSGIIRAFAQMDNEHCNLLIVGGGDELEKCKALAHELGVEKHVSFSGPTQDVGSYLSRADIFVSASLDEGVPNAAVEAMSYGLPVILTDVGFCSDLIDGNGVLLGNGESLARAMQEMAGSQNLQSMGERSRSLYFDHYTVEAMCLEHADFYNHVLHYSEGTVIND